MDIVPLLVTTNAAGGGTATAARNVRFDTARVLYAVEWVDGDLANGVDAVLSLTDTLSGVDLTLLTLTNADNDAWYFPRVAAHDGTAGALTHYVPAVVNGGLKLAVSNGGSVATGGAYVYLTEG